MSLATASLGEIAEVAAGGGAPQNADAFTAEGTPFIRAGSLNPLVNGASESSLEHLTDEVAKEHGLRKFPRDTVVFAKSGMSATKGHVYRLRNEAFVVNHIAAIVPTQRVVPEFLEHSLRVFSPVRLIQDAAYPSVRLSDVATMRIPLPPLAEQRRIAEVLDRAEALRAKRRAALAQLDSLTQSLFLDLFGNPIQNERKWPLAELREMSRVERGKFTPRPRGDPSYYGGRFPFIQTGDISSSGGRLNSWSQTLNEKGVTVSRSFPPGTVVIAIVGATLGITAILDIEVYCPDSVVGIQAQASKASPEYIERVLRFWRPIFVAQAPETARANINLETLRPLQVPLPPILLQREFARRVTAVEALKTAQRASLAELDALFATLQHRAFRGEL